MTIRQHLVCDLTVLRAHVQHAHWNYRGVNFMSVHPYLGGEVLDTISDMLDWCAEDLRRTGEPVDARLDTATMVSTLLAVPPAGIVDATYLVTLADMMREICYKVYDAFDEFNPSEQSSITAYTDKLEAYADFWFRNTL